MSYNDVAVGENMKMWDSHKGYEGLLTWMEERCSREDIVLIEIFNHIERGACLIWLKVVHLMNSWLSINIKRLCQQTKGNGDY